MPAKSVMVSEKCPGCNGEGWQQGNDGLRVRCSICFGSGRWQREYDYDFYLDVNKDITGKCPMCGTQLVEGKEPN